MLPNHRPVSRLLLHRLLVAGLVVCGFSGRAEPLGAQQVSPLTGEMQTPSLRGRTGSPTPIVWTLDWQGEKLLEGRLEWTVQHPNGQLAKFELDNLVLSQGKRSYYSVIPAVGMENRFEDILVQGRFITSTWTYQLGEFSVRPSVQGLRTFVICACDTWDVSAAPTTLSVERSLFLDQFTPDDEQASVSTTAFHLPARLMPSDPSSLCGYDLVLLGSNGLSELGDQELEALRQWVAAGGSLCLLLGGNLRPTQIQFLNQVCRGPEGSAPFVLGAGGTAVGGPEGDQVLTACGLGRVALVRRLPQEVTEGLSRQTTPDWRRLLGFLWKFRADQLPEFVEQGHWGEIAQPVSNNPYGGYGPGAYGVSEGLFVSAPINSGGWMLERLLPESVRTVPMSLIGAILLLYVIVVGPLDYIVLGWLRRRRYTWILFPVVTVIVTAATVSLSNQYMYSRTQTRSLYILDVGEDGTLVRSNRMEMLFTNTRRQISTEVTRGLFTPLNHHRFGIEDPRLAAYSRRGNPYGMDLDERGSAVPPTYRGIVPIRYTATQDVPQWTPQLNRTLTFAPTDPGLLTKFNWHTPDEQLSAAVGTEFGPSASAYRWKQGFLQKVVTGTNDPFQETSQTFLLDLCRYPENGFFKLASRVSPHGGGTFEDLALVDPSDAAASLLVVVLPRGDDFLVYRYAGSAK